MRRTCRSASVWVARIQVRARCIASACAAIRCALLCRPRPRFGMHSERQPGAHVHAHRRARASARRRAVASAAEVQHRRCAVARYARRDPSFQAVAQVSCAASATTICAGGTITIVTTAIVFNGIVANGTLSGADALSFFVDVPASVFATTISVTFLSTAAPLAMRLSRGTRLSLPRGRVCVCSPPRVLLATQSRFRSCRRRRAAACARSTCRRPRRPSRCAWHLLAGTRDSERDVCCVCLRRCCVTARSLAAVAGSWQVPCAAAVVIAAVLGVGCCQSGRGTRRMCDTDAAAVARGRRGACVRASVPRWIRGARAPAASLRVGLNATRCRRRTGVVRRVLARDARLGAAHVACDAATVSRAGPGDRHLLCAFPPADGVVSRCAQPRCGVCC